MIKHTVTFKFKDSITTSEKEIFFKALANLKSILGVQKFEILNRVYKDNNSEYAIFMEFENKETYQAYTQNEVHLDFIKNYWLKFVETFKEMDFDII
ncbi:MAG: Dabb family protein [Bacteroidota bacterium]